MDDAAIREHVQRHADAVVRGDMDTVAADLSEEAPADDAAIAQSLPRLVTSADVLGVDVGEETSVATIRYVGDDTSLTIQSQWRSWAGSR